MRIQAEVGYSNLGMILSNTYFEFKICSTIFDRLIRILSLVLENERASSATYQAI